ncbi:protein FAM133-like [Ptychodera flava]|uniref:protein FAM133-like n=1 Tax=Ptychodera flava TaxID=63121 RepID=UPI003969FD03
MSDQESSSSGSSCESESESEVEAESNDGPPPTQTKMKFDCPDDFAEVSYHDSSGPTVEDIGPGKELWLIRMPHNFDASKLNGQTVVLDGTQRIRQEGDSDIAYEVQSSTTKLSETSNLSVLLPSRKSKRLAPAPPISGQMNIIQSIVIPPMKIPQPPAPKYTELPEGLKLRYKPFGSLTPTPSKADTNRQQKDDNLGRKSKRLAEENEEESVETEVDASKKKKKKKKKRKTEEREEPVVETQTPNLRKKSDRGRKTETVTEHSSTKTESPNTMKMNDLSKTNKGEPASHPGRTKEKSFDFTNIELKEEISSSNNETDEVSKREKKKRKKDKKRKMTDEKNELTSEPKLQKLSDHSREGNTKKHKKKKKKN